METIRSFETSVQTRSTWRHIPEDGILHSHRRENLKSYIAFSCLKLFRGLLCDTVNEQIITASIDRMMNNELEKIWKEAVVT
jgi:hypothetical protein